MKIVIENIPQELATVRRWVCSAENKSPVNPRSLRGASSTNPDTWGSMAECVAMIGRTCTIFNKDTGRDEQHTVVGVGFTLGDGWAGIDLDAHNGMTIPETVLDDFKALGTYGEISRSGNGYHFIGKYNGEKLIGTTLPKIPGESAPGECVEIYTGGRYFAMTGKALAPDLKPIDITAGLQNLHHKYIKSVRDARNAKNTRNIANTRNTTYTNNGEWLQQHIEEILSYIPAEDRQTWIQVCAALKQEGFPFEVFDSWSRSATNYGGTAKAWNSFKRGDGWNGGTLVTLAKENGWKYQKAEDRYLQYYEQMAKSKPQKAPQAPFDCVAIQNPTEEEKPVETPTAPTDGASLFDAFFGKIQTEKYRPIATGISDLDRLLGGGIMRQGLIMLGAAPGMGKTTLAQQIFETMAKNGTEVLYFNLEMSREQLLARSISREISNDGATLTAAQVLRGYEWSDLQRRMIEKAAAKYRKDIAPNMIYNPGGDGGNIIPTIPAIMGALHGAGDRAKAEGKQSPVAVIDYLQLIQSEGREDQGETIKKAVAAFKQFAIDYETFVFVIMANNRMSNATGHATMESGRDTSAIEYSADIMLQMTYAVCKKYYAKKLLDFKEAVKPNAIDDLNPQKKKTARSNILLTVAKNRMNEPGGQLLLHFDGATSKFTPHDSRHDDSIPAWVYEADEADEAEDEY